MKKHSTINTFSTSTGERYTRAQIEGKVRTAKQAKLAAQAYEHGYNFCEYCEKNDCKPLDCSHTISVKECLERGAAELCWDLNNIRILGRDCHKKHDNVNLQFS